MDPRTLSNSFYLTFSWVINHNCATTKWSQQLEVKHIHCLRLLHLSNIIVNIQQGSKWANSIRLSKMSCYMVLSTDDLTQQDDCQVAGQPWVCLYIWLWGLRRFQGFCFETSPLAMSSICTSLGSNRAFLVSDSHPDSEKFINPSKECLQESMVLVVIVQT